MTVVVVTDSSAALLPELAAANGIRVVPLHILVDGDDLADGVDEIPADIHARQASTAGASPAELAAAYRRALADSGGDGVVAVHLSGLLSGTCGAAELAAAEIGEAVRVVDSRSTAMGTGFAALAAARAAASGADRDAVAAEAESMAARTHGYIVVQRLDNLRRSGRIGGPTAWLGTALALKPLLALQDGKLVLAQRVRTASRAVATMVDRVCEVAGDAPAQLAVHHVANPAGAAELAAVLAERLPGCAPAMITDLGPVLALHVGDGALAVVVSVPA